LGIFSFNPYFSRPNKTVNSSNMDFKQIQELIKMINKSNIGEVSIEEKGFKLTIKQKEEPVQQIIRRSRSCAAGCCDGGGACSYGTCPVAAAAPEKPAKPAEPPAGNTVTIKSPMIGTFYRSPSPDKGIFCQCGRRCRTGHGGLHHRGDEVVQ
jgi:acetyl-CoA carboxylase biotin carboxyl carrier protein